MILFLSFDGVLHTTGPNRQVFEKRDLLEQWLRQHPEVNIVISSKWRHDMSLDKLRQLFSEDLQHRIVGVTPTLQDQDQDAYWRLNEIFDWLTYCNSEQAWLVLDDGLFPDNFNRLAKCNPLLGLTHTELDTLTLLKRQLQTKQTSHGISQQASVV